LKKTVCGFLNADGGIILLGIHEDTKTKKRKVLGMQLNEVEK
jgi:predicted HTH transcriptional regulator